MIKIKTYISCLFIFIGIVGANAQICVLKDYRILDNTKVTIPIIFNGAVNNSLNTNGPCSIDMAFTHSTVGDLTVTLISPGGDEVTLIGPGVENSANTSLTRWDLEFIRCSNSASPYPTFNDTWDNLQSWGIFPGVYDGSYYPFENCFEDLNSGPINGTWYLEIEDVSGRNTGTIDSLCIQFCQDDGIVVEDCDPIVARFNRSSSRLCLGKGLDFDAMKIYPQGMPDLSLYDESYVVFSGDEIIDKTTNVDVSNYNEGLYTICPVTYRSNHASRVPDVGALMNKDSFQIALLENQVCGSISTKCHTTRIITSLDTFDINASICKGESFSFQGETYNTQGSFINVKPFADCDSIYRINVDVIDFQTSIESDFSNISCAVGQIWLRLNSNERSSLTTILWSTQDGNIVNQSFQDSVLINRPGTYEVFIEGKGCQDMATFEIVDEYVEPTMSFVGDTLITCLNNPSLISVTSNLGIATVDWSSDSTFTTNGIDLLPSKAGVYYAFLTTVDGCTVMDSIQLFSDLVQPNLLIESTDISCNTTATPLVVQNSNLYTDFVWLKNNTPYSTIANPDADGPGTYQLTVTNISNGCTDVEQVILVQDDYTIEFSVNDLEINCRTPRPRLTVTSSRDLVSFDWNGPNGFSSTTSRPSVDEIGTYTVNVIDNNGCIGDTFLMVGLDTLMPTISSFDDTKTCVLTSRVLTLPAIDPTYAYAWSGPFAFESDLPEPTVVDTGVYKLVVTAPNGCQDTKDFEVFRGPDLPAVTFTVDTLSCDIDTVEIVASDKLNYSFDWQTPDLIFNSDSSVVKVDTGTQVWVNVIENATGCSNRSEINIIDVRDFPEIQIFADDIDCNVSLASITLLSTPSFAAIRWEGPQGYTETSRSVVEVSTAGTYFAITTTPQGCEIIDSITIEEKMDSPVLNVEDVVIYCDPDSALISADSKDIEEYAWLFGGVEIGTNSSIVAREAGTYTLNVVGTNGCPSTGNIEVTVDTLPNPVSLVKSSDIQCVAMTQDNLNPIISFQSIDSLTSINWSGPGLQQISDDSIQVVRAGNYGVTTIDDRNCVSYAEVVIMDNTDFIQVNPFFKEIGCNQEGVITLSFDTEPQSGVFWRDPNGIVTGFGTEDLNVNLPGNYIYEVESPLGCLTIDSIQMTLDTLPPTILNTVGGEISCNVPILDIGFAVDRTIESVVWTNGKDTITDIATLEISQGGTYTASITASNNCVVIEDIVVTEDLDIPEVDIIVDTLTCLLSRVDMDFNVVGNLDFIDMTGPKNYSRKGRYISTPLYDTGQYVFIVQALNGCQLIDSINVIGDLEAPVIEISDTILLPCDGSPAVLGFQTMDSIINYRWIGEDFASTDPNPEVLDTQEIALFTLGSNGCPLLDTIYVLEDTRRTNVNIEKRDVFCVPDIGRLIAKDTQGIAGFVWQTPAGSTSMADTILTNDIGLYTLIVDMGNTCFDTLQSTLINDNNVPILDVTLNEPYQCKNTEVFLDVEVQHDSLHRLNYTWTTDVGNVISLREDQAAYVGSEGNYKFIVVDSISGCIDSVTYDLQREAQSLTDFDFSQTSPSCLGDRTGVVTVSNIMGGFGPYKYQLSGIGVKDEPEFTDLAAGDYQIKVVDSVGCELSMALNLNQGFFLDIELMPDTTIRLGDSLEIDYTTNIPTSQIVSIDWTMGNSIICDDCVDFSDYPISNTLYNVTLTNTLGCTATDAINVFILETIDWYMANVFSPNGDGQNDIFFPPANLSVESIINLSIFDAWGSVMYQVENAMPGDMSLGWDGKIGGRDVVPGVYVVIIEAQLKNNETKIFARDLTVVR